MPKLIVQNLKSKEEQDFDIPKETIVFGRTNTCDVELPQKSVSRRHAEIIRESGDFYLTDLKSGNGTFLNQKKLKTLEKNLLRSGDLIRIEDYEIRFLLTDEGEGPSIEEDTDTDIIEIKLIKKMLKALDTDETPSLEVLTGVATGHKLTLEEGKNEFLIGRGTDTDLPIDENVISRHHARLERKWGGIVITDLESKNGVFVNHERVKEKLLRDGDKVMLGTVKILYRNPKDINLEIINQEMSRKKREAAMVEAEALEAKAVQDAEDAEAQEKQDAEAKAVEAALEAPPPEPADIPTEEGSKNFPEARASTPLPKEGFSTFEKAMIGAGILVGLTAIGGLVMLLLK